MSTAKTTLDALQSLSDARFHQLCDELLPALEERYSTMVPYGLNLDGQSVKGHPDSFVGNSPTTCTIAFEYSVQKSGWQDKAIADIAAAKACSSEVSEIVIALIMDINRGQHSKKHPDWVAEVVKCAAPAKLTVFDGRGIAHLLDTQFEHLRWRYLNIPCSRLSAESIIASCQKWNDSVLDRLSNQGRYHPNRYTERECDSTLWRLWQLATDYRRSGKSAVVIPIVDDSGIGKTSIVAHLVDSINDIGCALFLQARDISFERDDAIIRTVLACLQGVIDDESRRLEESAVARILASDSRLTVMLDGLDEASDPNEVRRAISHWIVSQMGERSTLIMTSRPEFWQRCQESSWRSHYLLPDSLPANSGPVKPCFEVVVDSPHARFALGSFNLHEAARVWELTGQSPDEFYALPPALQVELRHPFTLIVASELLATGITADSLVTRTEIMEQWIDARLHLQSKHAGTRVSPDLLREALLKFARLVDESGSSWQRVDQLTSLPGFNPASPPGYVCEHLLDANLLERRDEFGTEFRFALEAVQDFFVAENHLSRIESDPHAAAQQYVGLTFTGVETRLERIGRRLSGTTAQSAFVEHLLNNDPWKAAIVLRACRTGINKQFNAAIAKWLGDQLTNTFSARRAKAAEILGQLQTKEAHDALSQRMPQTSGCGDLEAVSLAIASLRLSVVEGVPCIFACRWFREVVFFSDVRAYLASTSLECRKGLADYAFSRLAQSRGTKDHLRATIVLAYLQDERLLADLERRTHLNERIHWYEINSLLNFECGRSAALYGQLFSRWIVAYAAQRNGTNEILDNYWTGLTGLELRGSVRRLSPQIEECILLHLQSGDSDAVHLAIEVIKRFPSEPLVEAALPVVPGEELIPVGFGRAVGHIFNFDAWKVLWDRFTDNKVRQRLIAMTPKIRNRRVEASLIAMIDDPKIATAAIEALGEIRCLGAAPRLRKLLELQNSPASVKNEYNATLDAAIMVLGRIRDPAAVEGLAAFVLSDRGIHTHNALRSLAQIKTDDAGDLLIQYGQKILANDSTTELTLGALVKVLVDHGATECVELALQVAKHRPNSIRWLMEQVSHATMFGGWARWRFYPSVDLAPIIEFVRDGFDLLIATDKKEVLQDFGQFDGASLREFLKDVIAQENASAALSAGSNAVLDRALGMLAERGDESAITHAVDNILARKAFYMRYGDGELQNFSRDTLTQHLLGRLDSSRSVEQAIRLLHLVGEFGALDDAERLSGFENDPEPRVANAACFSVTRLKDPRLLPEDWA